MSANPPDRASVHRSDVPAAPQQPHEKFLRLCGHYPRLGPVALDSINKPRRIIETSDRTAQDLVVLLLMPAMRAHVLAL